MNLISPYNSNNLSLPYLAYVASSWLGLVKKRTCCTENATASVLLVYVCALLQCAKHYSKILWIPVKKPPAYLYLNVPKKTIRGFFFADYLDEDIEYVFLILRTFFLLNAQSWNNCCGPKTEFCLHLVLLLDSMGETFTKLPMSVDHSLCCSV